MKKYSKEQSTTLVLSLLMIGVSIYFVFNYLTKEESSFKSNDTNQEVSDNILKNLESDIDYYDEISNTLKDSRAPLYSESKKFERDNNLDGKITETPVKIEFEYNNKTYTLDALQNKYDYDNDNISTAFISPRTYIDLYNLDFAELKEFKNLRQEAPPKKLDQGYIKWREEYFDNIDSDNFIPTPGFEDYQYTVIYKTLISQDNQEILVTLADMNPADVNFINFEGGESIPQNTYTYVCDIQGRECSETNILDKANKALDLAISGFMDFPYFAWDSQYNLIFYLLRDRYTEDGIIRHYMHIYDINNDKVTKFELDLSTAIKK